VTSYERHVVSVPEGASVVLYTDGLIEDRTRSIDVGLAQLRDALVGARLTPDAACDHVLEAMGREAGGEDDIALLVMRHT
jgi:serine phosphatase RsbU (regulator of sigma subunit)